MLTREPWSGRRAAGATQIPLPAPSIPQAAFTPSSTVVGTQTPNSVQYFCIKLRQTKKKTQLYLVAIISAVEMKRGKKGKKKGSEAAEFTILTATGRHGKYHAALSPSLPRQRRGLRAGRTSHGPGGFAVYRGTGSCREPGPALLTGQAQRASHFLWIPLR